MLGAAAAIHYSLIGLALSHYDARAHLVVSRRVFDSIVPGWQQIGAVWLPLPHLLDMVPVQIDALYRTGAFAILISVASVTLAAWAAARMIQRVTGSASGGLAAAALLLVNPNLLYLQSTPMTEPLLFGTTMLAVMLVAEWIDREAPGWPHAAGLAVTAACMTRYEAWPITAATVGFGVLVLLRRGVPLIDGLRAGVRLSVYPAVAVLLFLCNSRWTTGEWVVSTGFFVAENEARGQGWLAWRQIRIGTYQLSGWMLVWPAYLSAILIAVAFVRSRARASLTIALALAGSAALPWYAYVNGHPLRVRYSLPLVFAASILCGVGIALLPRRIRAVAAVLLVAGVLAHDSPLDRGAPMVLEAQRDNLNRAGRQAVTDYLVAHVDPAQDEVIFLSMGSLAHYIHDLSAYGFQVRNFLHEGNGDLWVVALARGPHGLAKWMLIEEQAEGGDALFQRSMHDPNFLRDYQRVVEGGGVALYQTK